MKILPRSESAEIGGRSPVYEKSSDKGDQDETAE